ncbi:MAG TPA: alpha-glucan family phosphorylase [Anaerolineaceae bacterium]|nr:alpha-glucan family phosphorylase [Anaerolineaceae bacterium]HQP08379.1 alpha-glucan family phosphorylase [Anaerolineaceae bacterium]
MDSKYTVKVPNNFNLPRRIGRLGELAYNLWWVWNPEAQLLYRLIDRTYWETSYHNPVSFLRGVSRPALNAVLNDRYYLDMYDRVFKAFDLHMTTTDTWYSRTVPQHSQNSIAYFSFEFGLHESLPVYAGGLGVLSGDHLKESSDLGLPLVGVGFVYNEGYFQQRITEDGWQETRNTHIDFAEKPICPLLNHEGKPLTISVDLPERKAHARIWLVQVGRIPLYLLDTNLEENTPADRQLNARLYSNDLETRISQEIMLGVGGVRTLRELGYNPTVWHMNEGHSAFLILERARELVDEGFSFEEAIARTRTTNVFTTHTPVPAGNDQFPLWLLEKYGSVLAQGIKLEREQFIDLGRQPQSWGDMFSMPVLALKYSDGRNAVSELHGQVSRRMWNFLWKDVDEDDVPITHITNGIHSASWLARRMRILFDRYLGVDWMQKVDDLDVWARAGNIPDGELWAVRNHLKRKLAMFANERARQSWSTGGVAPVQVVASGVLMEPYALTIGFARRFATYKRADLILQDFDRLLSIINNPSMPVQIIFSGKAHPADEPSKMIIQKVYRAVKNSRTAGRLIFLEDYDMNVARYLVQGVDVWLNTPRRPNEASGTSGMKAALNGVLQFSTLDGWWREGYNGRNGWAIGQDKEFDDTAQQDAIDSASLYETLQDQIVPLFYHNRTSDSLPVEWIAMMKESIRTLAPQFSTHRMVKEYMQQMYEPAMRAVKK